MTELDANQVGQRARRGISWNLIGGAVTNAMRIVVVAVLGRVLDSADFGVVAVALSITIVLHSIRDIGIGPALIQRSELAPGHVATAFALSSYLGAAIAALVVITAPFIGELYRIPESVDILRALGLIFALRGVASVSSMMCQRAMNFRAVAMVDAGAYATGAAVSMTLAICGAGPWALVGGYLVEELLSTVLYLMLYRPPFTLRIDRARLRDLLGFGAGQSVIQVAGILATYGDNFVVGHSLGKGALGYYTRAYDLIKLPSALFTNIVGNVLFPAFSRLQRDPVRLAAGYRRITFLNALVLFPASAVLIVTAPEVIRILMGGGWSDSVTPFRILAITMMFRTSYKVGAMVASAAGHVHKVAIANVVYMACVIAGASITIRWGIAGVAVSTALALCVVYLHCSAIAVAVSGLSVTAFITAHVPGIALAVAIGAPIWIVATRLRDASAPFAATFAIAVVIGLVLGLAGLALGLRLNRGDFGWLGAELGRVASRFRPTPQVPETPPAVE
jgi:PST family polysaccharide transporter